MQPDNFKLPNSADELTDVQIMKLVASMPGQTRKEEDIDPDVYRKFFEAIFG